MTCHSPIDADHATLIRPRLLVETARIGAAMYRRRRDLPGALPGAAGGPEATIVPRLSEAEQAHEALRVVRSPAYRPRRHLQVLAALLAEAALAAKAAPLAKAA